jgi:hypothetical protein
MRGGVDETKSDDKHINDENSDDNHSFRLLISGFMA